MHKAHAVTTSSFEGYRWLVTILVLSCITTKVITPTVPGTQ
jgi:hypothetical protein